MILTPGIAFTMGIRDFVQGDYRSSSIIVIITILNIAQTKLNVQHFIPPYVIDLPL